MTKLMQQLMDVAAKLPDADQDALAERVLSEIDDDAAWERAFGASQPQLSKLAVRVRQQIAHGQATQQEMDQL